MRKVLVLGAGLAGLTAARQLQHFGFQVKVLEARVRDFLKGCIEVCEGGRLQPRVGGRMATYRNMGAHVDLGAHAIHGLCIVPLSASNALLSKAWYSGKPTNGDRQAAPHPAPETPHEVPPLRRGREAGLTGGGRGWMSEGKDMPGGAG